MPYFKNYLLFRNVFSITFMLSLGITSHLNDKTSLFDERYFIYFEDTDFFLQLKCDGKIVRYIPFTTAIHYHEQTTLIAPFLMYEAKVKSSLEFYKKNYSLWKIPILKMILLLGLLLSLIFHLFSNYKQKEFLKRRTTLIKYVLKFN